MLLVFTTALPALDPIRATQLLQEYGQFNPSLRIRKEGGYYLTIPSHHVPLRTHRLLREFGQQRQNYKWRLYGLDDEGNPTVPIQEDSP